MAISTGAGLAIAGGATAASGLASAGASLYGSSQASSASKASAYYQALQNQVTTNLLSPFRETGQSALSRAAELAQGAPAGTPYLAEANQFQNTAAQNMPPSQLTEGWLEQTPGYQFTQTQGQKAVQAAAAARGLGVSGASLKGAATYATGLADATYSNRFNEAQQTWSDFMQQATGKQNLATLANQQQSGQISSLTNIGNIGEAAAAQTATSGTQAAANYGNYLNQSGQAQAAGTTGAGNALTSGVNNYLSYSALQSAIAGGQSGQTAGIGSPGSAVPNYSSNTPVSGVSTYTDPSTGLPAVY